MSHENAKILYKASQEAQQKFEYFLTGAIGAMFAYTAQTYTPKKLDFSPSTMEPVAIICFAVAFYFGIRRIDCLYHHLGISSQEAQALGDAKELENALRMVAENPLVCTPRAGMTVSKIESDLEHLRSRAQSAKTILKKLDDKVGSFYTWRNRLMLAGFFLIFLGRVLSPYYTTTKPQIQQIYHPTK